LTNLNKIKGKIFQDPKKVQDYMIENASDAIKRMRKAAESLRDQCFSIDLTEEVVEENSNNQNNAGVQVETNDDIIMVDLGGGVKAKMNSSSLAKVVNQ